MKGGAPLHFNAGWHDKPEATYFVAITEELLEAVQDQLKDNEMARFAHFQAIDLQIRGQAVHKEDLLAYLYEDSIPTSLILDSFAVDLQRLKEIRDATPISIIGCLECGRHLPDDDRRTLLRQLRLLSYLGNRFEAGDLVELGKLCELLCKSCSQEYRHCCEEQLRTELLVRKARQNELKKMTLHEYLQTREWKVIRSRKLIQAGNKCQTCSRSDVQLDVHHNCYDRRFGVEHLSDLVVLCRRCHSLYHGILPDAA